MLDELDLGRRQNILIVEDVKLNAQVLVNALQDEYDLRVANNGVEALAMVREQLPDLILLDIVMPEMDGYEVCAALQADHNTRDIPILFLTALEGDKNEATALNLVPWTIFASPLMFPLSKQNTQSSGAETL